MMRPTTEPAVSRSRPPCWSGTAQRFSNATGRWRRRSRWSWIAATAFPVSLLSKSCRGSEPKSYRCSANRTARSPNHHPDPSVMENLTDMQEAVRRTNAALGIAFDGDGDRIGIVDERGEVVFGDKLLALYGRDLVQRAGGGHHVIFDVKCSDILASDLERVGLQPVMWKTGHSLIKAKMKELDAPLAGEMSGHMFFGGDYYGFDDALFGAARLLDYLARANEPVSVLLSNLPERHSTPELRVDCDDKKKFDVVARATEHFSSQYDTLDIDGVRISFADGWGLIRASNTQPVLVMRFEAGSPAALNEYRGEVEGWLSSQMEGVRRERRET